jgi:hypothetical protein
MYLNINNIFVEAEGCQVFPVVAASRVKMSAVINKFLCNNRYTPSINPPPHLNTLLTTGLARTDIPVSAETQR